MWACSILRNFFTKALTKLHPGFLQKNLLLLSIYADKKLNRNHGKSKVHLTQNNASWSLELKKAATIREIKYEAKCNPQILTRMIVQTLHEYLYIAVFFKELFQKNAFYSNVFWRLYVDIKSLWFCPSECVSAIFKFWLILDSSN